MNEIDRPLNFTGERMVPEAAPSHVFWDHVHRYRFATRFVRGKKVLDIACGEGYGSKAMLSAGAASVIGIDVDPATCDHARRKYGIDARTGDAVAIPVADRSVDVVVSFETIEHVADPDAFVRECTRVLQPDGCLLVSTPNVAVYNPDGSPDHNPFHCSEMTETEFASLLARYFSEIGWFFQRASVTPRWSLRSFAIEDSPWASLFGIRMRGYGRLRRYLSREEFPWIERAARLDPVAAILAPESLLQRITSGSTVWPQGSSAEKPKFFICVAGLPITARCPS